MNKSNQSSIEVIKLSAYTTPEIVEKKNKSWVEYGEDNNYFQYLIDRYNNSTTNNAAINGISKFIYGKGIFAYDSSIKIAQWTQFLTMLRPACVKKVVKDKKVLGMACLQVIYINKVPVKLEHYPMETLRPEKANEEGEIEAWYYHPKWVELKPSENPEKIPAYGFGNGNEPELLIWKDYCPSMYYFSPPDYKGALPYALLEEEISDYLINDTQNGFSGTKIINFNNGVPDQEKREEITRDIKSRVSGSRGDKIIVAFNKNKDSQTDLQDVQLNNAPEHYSYLSEECFRKLIVGHGITSPNLLGIREGNSGLGNNADEIKVATQLFQSVSIEPIQRDFIDLLNPILADAGINLDLYFKSTEPIEFQEEPKQELKKVCLSVENDFTDEEGFQILDLLKGETLDLDEWELVEKREVKEDNESTEAWANNILNKVNLWTKLSDFISSKPSDKSSLDEGFHKVRYEYNERYASDTSRNFCKQMMSRTSRGVVYRKEDVDQASFQGVNKELGHKGRPYSLFKFKGGVNCGHFWSENLYKLKRKTNGQFVKDKSLASSKEVDSIAGYKPNPSGWKDAQIAPKDMPNNGHHPNFKG